MGYVEAWTAINAPRDWEALEKADSESTDAGEEASIADDMVIPDDAEDADADDAVVDDAETEDTEDADADSESDDAEADTDDSADAE